MVSTKSLTLEITKEEGYLPLTGEQKENISEAIIKEITELAERFDGYCRIEIKIEMTGKGNA